MRRLCEMLPPLAVLAALGAGVALAASVALGAGRAGDPVETMVERGRAALAAGRHAEAVEHLSRALVHRPGSSEVLGLLFEAAEGDADARALWGVALLASAVGETGRVALERGLLGGIQEGVPEAEGLVEARVAAISELEDLARARRKKERGTPSQALVAWWAESLAARLARPCTSARSPAEPGVERALALPDKLPSQVAKKLKRVLSAALSAGRPEEAARAAWILRGLGNQAGSKDLQGEAPPGAAPLEAVGAEGLARARQRLAAASVPLTLELLEELDEEAQLAFTRAHASVASPGLGLSPEGLYRVETVCGYQTLLGVVATVEEHHRRLASWYGEDPFAGRPGLVRVLPEAAGLEAEGTPFWWAGGFQAGDLTVLRFSVGNVAGLGRGLTHELAHRFDGALYPGLPAWLAEGRAVWTGSAYAFVESEEFVPNHVSFGTVEQAFIKGYGGRRKLGELIEGTLEDYRDNYVAGYALWVYLMLWEAGGGPLFAERLEPYMKGIAKGADDPLGWFEQHFADGRGARPEGIEAFTAGWAEFLKGFYWETRAEWTKRYVHQLDGDHAPWVYDEPTWTWSRSRAEPFYGQDHAWRAGQLFLELEKEREALDAWLWALEVDERSPLRNAEVAALLGALRRTDAAWVLQSEGASLARTPGDGGGEPCAYLDELRRTVAFVEALRAAANSARERGAQVAAMAWDAEANDLAARLGLPLESLPAAPAEPGEAALLHPVHEPLRRLDLAGWEERGLTGYEERRVPELWYGEENGDLHVGRARPRTGTGKLDRTAHNRHAFTATREWLQPGRYRITCRVQFTTSFVSGALILGDTRRDRNVRVGFSAGDFMYAIGKKEEAEELDGVHWSVRGLRDREGALPGSVGGGRVEFDAPRAHFGLEVVVDGGALHVWIEGRHVATYHTPDGQPIEGRVGFATSYGAIRVIEPRVQRLDATWHARTGTVADEELHALDGPNLLDPGAASFERLVNRAVRGLPRSTRGTLVVWTPLPELDEEGDELDREGILRKARKLAERAAALLERAGGRQPIALAVPALLGEEDLAALETDLAEVHAGGLRVLGYRGAPLVYDPEAELPGRARTWLLFVDSANVLRLALRFYGFFEGVPEGLDHWLAVFREHRGGH